jgi:ribonuclease P protein component
MNRKYRLKSSRDFRRVRRTGKSYAHPLAVLIASPNEQTTSRFGVIASRAVGGAVARNRAKRRLRASLARYFPEITPGWDVVLIARAPLLNADWEELQRAVETLLRRAAIIIEN